MAGEAKPEDAARMKELNSLLQGGDYGVDNMFSKALVFTAQQLPIQGTLIGESLDEMAMGALMYGTVAAGATGASGGAAAPAIIPSMLMGAGHGFLAGRMRTAFDLEKGLAFAQFQELGLDRENSIIAARGVGAINASLESLGAGALLKRVPGFNKIMTDRAGDAMAKVFSAPTTKAALTRLTMQYGEGMATELVTEVAQETTLMLAQEVLKTQARDAGDTRPELDAITGDEFWETWKQTAIHTLYGTSIIGAAGPIMNFRADARRAHSARQQQQMWAALGEAADGSTTRTEANSAWQEFVSRVQKDGPLKEIRVDAEGWRTYWQSKEMDPVEMANELGIDLSESETMDTDLTLPFDVFIDKIAPTEHLNGLMKDLRVREDQMTMREAEQWQKDRKKHIEQIKEALGDELDTEAQTEIQRDLSDQLVNVGYEPKAAKSMAELHSLVVMNKAMQSGKDPMQLYKQTLAGIFQDTPEALQAAGEDIDMQMDPMLDRIRNEDFPHQRDIYGESLVDMVRRVGGINEESGEFPAKDINQIRPGTVRTEGRSADDLAEQAFEAGFIAERDVGLFTEAFNKDIGGDPVFSRTADTNQELEELLGAMEQAARAFELEGIDIKTMTNAEIRAYFEGMNTFEQSSADSLKEWSDLVMAVTQMGDRVTEGAIQPNEIDTLLTKAEAAIPRLAAGQNFKGVELTDRVDIDGKEGDVTYNAQEAYKEAVKSRNILKRLADCVNG